MNFTHQNHLRYTIGGRLYGFRETIYEKYQVQVGAIDPYIHRQTSWANEQKRTADLIYKDFGKDFVVMFSGGTDSEIVLRSFLKIGIKPKPVFIRFTGGYNSTDAAVARYICQQLGLELEELEFDIIEFYNSGQAWDFASEIHCRQMAYLTVYHHIRQLQLPAVMGGELLLRRSVTPKSCDWFYCFRENEDASAMRFSQKYQIPLVNEWFSYTPEMIGKFLEFRGVQDLLKERYKLASVTSKNKILIGLLPEIIKKPKTHGFEKLLGFNGETYDTLHRSHVKRLESSLDGVMLKDLYRQLYTEDLYNEIYWGKKQDGLFSSQIN